jgi:hypothetical protein
VVVRITHAQCHASPVPCGSSHVHFHLQQVLLATQALHSAHQSSGAIQAPNGLEL